MAKYLTKYITINDNLYKIEEYEYKGYGDSRILSNNMTKVPNEDVEKIKRMVAEQGEEIPNKYYR